MQRSVVQPARYARRIHVGTVEAVKGRECYLDKFKSHFKVDFFEGSSSSPLDSEQPEVPSWVKEYYERL